jgi:vitamin B12 transporter
MSFPLRTRALLAPCVLGVVLICGAPTVAGAQAAPTPAPSASPLAEIGTVTTSDRRLESVSNTTRPTFVIDRAAIENNGSRTIGDALANVPGLNIFSYGPFGAQNNYGIRGTTSAETLVLQDGVPIATGSNGTVDLGSLSTVGVQRIEVVESGSSTLYGSAATGGVINIITSAGATPYARIANGSFANWDVAAQAGTSNLAVSYERHTAANIYDYPAFAYAGGNATPAGTRMNDAAQQTVVRVSYLADLGAGWTARISGGDDTINIGVPGGLSFLTPFAQQGTNRTDALLDVAHAAGSGEFHLTLSGVGQKLLFSDTLVDLTGTGTGIGEQDTFDGRTQASLRYSTSSAHGDLVTGIDLSRETALLTFPPSSPPQSAVGAAESQSALYVQAGYDPSSAVRLIFGVRGENDSPRGSVLAPSVGARVNAGGLRFTANLGESFRVPTLVDLYFPGFSNPNLLPEKLSNYDATVSLPHFGGGISLGYFGRNGANLIAVDPTTFIPFNASHVSVNGLQFTIATPAIAHIRATASITDLYRALDTTTGLRLPSTPPIFATLGIERPFDAGKLAFGGHVRVVGSTSDVPNFSGGAPFPDPYNGYFTADAYVRYAVSKSAILTGRVRDLGDARYAPIFGYPAPGRTYTVELATR